MRRHKLPAAHTFSIRLSLGPLTTVHVGGCQKFLQNPQQMNKRINRDLRWTARHEEALGMGHPSRYCADRCIWQMAEKRVSRCVANAAKHAESLSMQQMQPAMHGDRVISACIMLGLRPMA